MPTPIHMTVEGAKQGPFKGSVTMAGREDSIEVFDLQHQLHSPSDISSGRATGKRQHMPVKVLCAIDKSTPLFYGACAQNEIIVSAKFSFYDVDMTGAEVEYFNIEISNARVVDVKLDIPNVRDVKNENYPHMAEYSMNYEKIIWTWVDGSITVEDDWQTPT